jgi:tRNA(fMet)-specific endonuclease VapC
MNGRFAVDTNAVVDYLRESRPIPPALLTASEILLPLTVLGELFAGAFASERAAENLDAIARLAAVWPVLVPDSETARIYGRIRAGDRRQRTAWTEPARNDFWIAAVCLQHSVPLLSNDKAFDEIGGLQVMHW